MKFKQDFVKKSLQYVSSDTDFFQDDLKDIIAQEFSQVQEYTLPNGNLLSQITDDVDSFLIHVSGPSMNILKMVSITTKQIIHSTTLNFVIRQVVVNTTQEFVALRGLDRVVIINAFDFTMVKTISLHVAPIHVTWGKNRFFPNLVVFLDSKKVYIYDDTFVTCQEVSLSSESIQITSCFDTFRGIYAKDVIYVDAGGVSLLDPRDSKPKQVFSQSLCEIIEKDTIHPSQYLFATNQNLILFDLRMPNRSILTQRYYSTSPIKEIVIQDFELRRNVFAWSNEQIFHFSYFDMIRQMQVGNDKSIDYLMTRCSPMMNATTFEKTTFPSGKKCNLSNTIKRNIQGLSSILYKKSILLFQSSDIGDVFVESMSNQNVSDLYDPITDCNPYFLDAPYSRELDVLFGSKQYCHLGQACIYDSSHVWNNLHSKSTKNVKLDNMVTLIDVKAVGSHLDQNGPLYLEEILNFVQGSQPEMTLESLDHALKQQDTLQRRFQNDSILYQGISNLNHKSRSMVMEKTMEEEANGMDDLFVSKIQRKRK